MSISKPGFAFTIVATLVVTCLVTLAGVGSPGGPAFAVLHSRQNISWLCWLILAPAVIALARRFPFGAGSSLQWLLRHIGIGAAFAFAALAMAIGIERLMMALGHTHSMAAPPPMIASMATGLLIYGLIAVSYQALSYHTAERSREATAARLRADLAEARVASLEGKLHPHFLFNALNSIAALIRQDPVGAETMLEQLSDLLRATLTTNPSREVSLDDALELTSQYLAIEQVRYRERLRTLIEAPSDTRQCRVPQLILQPLVENAVRHGIAPIEGGGFVKVSARIQSAMLHITVEDDGIGLGNAAPESAGSGLGLRAVRTALSHLYGAAQHFDIRPREPRGTIVNISLPCRTSA